MDNVLTTHLRATGIDLGATAGIVNPNPVDVFVAAEEGLVVVAFGVATSRCQPFQLDDIIAADIPVFVVAALSAAGVAVASRLKDALAAYVGFLIVDTARCNGNGRRYNKTTITVRSHNAVHRTVPMCVLS